MKQIKETKILAKQHHAKEALFWREKRQANKSLVASQDTLRKKTHELSLVEADHCFNVSVVVAEATRKERTRYASVIRKERTRYASVIRSEKDQGVKTNHASMVSSDVLII